MPLGLATVLNADITSFFDSWTMNNFTRKPCQWCLVVFEFFSKNFFRHHALYVLVIVTEWLFCFLFLLTGNLHFLGPFYRCTVFYGVNRILDIS